MLDDSGPSSQSSQTNLNHPIWGTPNGQNRPGVTVTGLEETKPGLEGPPSVLVPLEKMESGELKHQDCGVYSKTFFLAGLIYDLSSFTCA